MAKILIKNGPPEFDVIYAYFRQRGFGGGDVKMTLVEEGVASVYDVEIEIMFPWTGSTKTWKFRGYVRSMTGSMRTRYFVGEYSFKTRTGEGEFVDKFVLLPDIKL